MQDFIIIAQGAFEMKSYNHAFDWFAQALHLLRSENADLKVELFILERLANTSLKVKIKFT